MKRQLILLVCVALVAAAGSPAASAGVKFVSIKYNPAGADTSANVNSEYVMLTNDGARGVSLRGWRLRDKQGNVYRFGRYTLAGGSSVVVRTGRGTNDRYTRYWGRSWHVWNNRGDVATLRRASGTFVDRCRYVGTRLGYKQC